MDEALRALIVARLRAEADAVEAGASIDGYCYDPLHGTTIDIPEGSREEADAALDHYRDEARYDGWPEEVEQLAWGVMVPIESIAMSDKWCYRSHGWSEAVDYALFAEGTASATEPERRPCDDEYCEQCRGGGE